VVLDSNSDWKAIYPEVFPVFLSTPRKFPGQYLKLVHDCFLPHSFYLLYTYYHHGGMQWWSWLRDCDTSLKVMGLIPYDVIGVFH
jgi:hypothetical protein